MKNKKNTPVRVSLAFLANELGVSRTTVSNAYNRPEQLSVQLRNKILRRAEQLGYPGPDPTARSLRTKRIGSVGVLLTEHLTYAFEDRASVDFLSGMADSSIGTQNSLTLVPVGPDSAEEDSALVLVNQAVVDGFVVYSVAENDPYLAAVHRRGLPVVVCDQPNNDDRFPFVGIDDFAAIAPAAHALVDAGHTRIGILCIRLSPDKNNGPVSPQRLAAAKHHVQKARVEGALKVFASAGIDPAAVPIVERHINDPKNNICAAKELLSTHPDLTAVLCTTDTMAFGVLEYAKQHNIQVPQELSVTGFDGIAPALERSLTTVIQPNKEKGATAGKVLATMIKGGDYQHRSLLETSFFPGATVASP
ncbi:MAG: LacI family DNA-binding transcriptional regulator [Corynebacterium sp.]|uniref:LacI family DNA-binding transcriptional regulator n=1 Tax=Corynebacterium sp. TaxID=1720 RepID=UPI0026DB4896|nr:LacI family DNA-binding transcriptional regulator [Corynebacterium sp.]MDO4761020.1 LacI family DNA-binding transcriptional regulator [Corynebacterium sp.]